MEKEAEKERKKALYFSTFNSIFSHSLNKRLCIFILNGALEITQSGSFHQCWVLSQAKCISALLHVKYWL